MTIITNTLQRFATPIFNIIQRDITTAGIIVIGDEILKGQVQDTNSRYLATEIRKMGIHVKKISIIGDVIPEVSDEVRIFSARYDHVITTGGIGPTHDDITYAAVARAFNQPLVLNDTLKEICLKFYKTNDIDRAGKKMAYIPQEAKLMFNSNILDNSIIYPNVSVGNVYMFPGIPEFLMKTFNSVKDAYFKSEERFFIKTVYVKTPESQIVNILDKVVHECPHVQVGSYPKLNNKQYKVKLTVESSCEGDTKLAYEKLVALLPKEHIVNADDVEDN